MAGLPKVLFCHGLESGPHGSKFQALRAAGLDVVAPDGRGKSLAQRVEIVTQWLEQSRPLLVGSSYGGITAVLAAQRASVELPGMVLCAPALEIDESPNVAPHELRAPCPTVIIHGTHDDVIPIAVSRRFADRTGTTLIEVDDGHRLAQSHGVIIEAVKRLM